MGSADMTPTVVVAVNTPDTNIANTDLTNIEGNHC